MRARARIVCLFLRRVNWLASVKSRKSQKCQNRPTENTSMSRYSHEIDMIPWQLGELCALEYDAIPQRKLR